MSGIMQSTVGNFRSSASTPVLVYNLDAAD